MREKNNLKAWFPDSFLSLTTQILAETQVSYSFSSDKTCVIYLILIFSGKKKHVFGQIMWIIDFMLPVSHVH